MKARQVLCKMAVMMAGILFITNCSSSDSAEQVPSPEPIEIPEYQGYLTANGLRADVINVAELAARTRL